MGVNEHLSRIFIAARFGLLLALAIGLPSAAWTSVAAQMPAPALELDPQLPESLARCVSADSLQTSYERARERHADAHRWEQPGGALRVELRSGSDSGTDVTRVEVRAYRRARLLGERVLSIRAEDCDALPDTLALILELLSRSAVEPTGPPPTAATDLQAPDTALELPPILQPEAAIPSQAHAEREWVGGVAGGVFFGALPRTAVVLQLLAALRVPFLDLRARATALWPQELAVAEGTVAMLGYELALEACPGWELGGWALRLCVGPRLGIVRATSRGFAVRNRDASELSLYLGALPEVAFAIADSTWLQLSSGVAFALQRPKFVLNFQGPDPPLALDGPKVVRVEISLSVLQVF
jgi:hypothetical protein